MTCTALTPLHSRRVMRRWLLCLCAVLALAALGCEKDAQTLTNEGNVALVGQDYDTAVTRFNEALKKDAANFDAVVGLAEVYTLKGDFPKARENFEKARGMEAAKSSKLYLDQKYQEFLLKEAEAASDKTSDAYRDALWKVIEVRDRGFQANQAYLLLSEYYMERGDTLAKDKATREKAVENYLAFRKIRVQRSTRKQAIDKATKLQRAIYDDAFAARADALKKELTEKELWDDAGRVKARVSIESDEINPKTDEEKDGLQKRMARQGLLEVLKYSYRLADVKLPAEVKDVKLLNFQSFKVDSAEFERGKADVVVSVELKEIQNLAYKGLVVPARKAAEKAAAKAGAKGAEKAAPAGEKAAPAGEKAAPAGEKAAPAGEKAAPAGEKAAPAGEKAAPAGEKAAPAGEKAAPAGEKAAPAGEKAAPAEGAK